MVKRQSTSPLPATSFSSACVVNGTRLVVLFAAAAMLGCSDQTIPRPKTDEAFKRKAAERVSIDEAAAYYNYRTVTVKGDRDEMSRKRIVYDYFDGMDAIAVPENQEDAQPDQLLGPDVERRAVIVTTPVLNESELVGRNTWMAWCGGNEGFWDWLATDSLGFIDFVRLLDTRERDQRFDEAGLINEPGMRQANQPSAGEFDLWLDIPEDDRVRKWRQAYVATTFQQIAEGSHKSQIGLKKGPDYDPSQQVELYVGEPDAFKGQGYLYPSDYLREDGKRREDADYGDGGPNYDLKEDSGQSATSRPYECHGRC
jgi:hypothetical protein